MKRLLCLPIGALALAGCGGGGGSPSFQVQPAAVYALAQFKPAGTIVAGRPTPVSFRIQQPDGKPLTQFKRGPGPHTGVHLIMVRGDLAYIIHHHPPVDANGTLHDTVTFPAPGPYRVVVDVYPAGGSQPNFQLFRMIRVSGAYHPQPLPATSSAVTVGGYHFTLSGASNLHAIQAGDVVVHVTGPSGPPTFTPWYGALAHAIFFRKGSLDYFHTHVCSPGATGCTSILGPAKVTGTSTQPGKLTVGVLVPAPGTWRLFLQCKLGGHVLTAPFTLHVT
ncbi:MAG: hypothetical protein JO064_01515 [Actinobacteria bacterium]|nr:hypothetical protein [Actinomycetota bacterium]MBV8598789.1 hypothetical protein [Actinomycetota bacterium]